jgi:hypothetical protein
MENSIMLQAK